MVPTGNRPDNELAGIELISIYKKFGNTEVLRDLSIQIREGELCCLLGPSGCGKTTALKIINGLLEPENGSVFLLGNDITDVSPQKRNLGMVFQNYALFPHLSVYDNIAYGLKRRKVRSETIKEKVTATLELVQLNGIEHRRIHELSGGQQQRVALARALVIEPKALLLDEPLSNLDAKLRGDMRDEIRKIQTQLGITTVYVTHDQEEAMSIADRIVVMNNGNIEQIGTPIEIYENPATAFVASFVGNINFIPGLVKNKKLTMLNVDYVLPSGNLPEGMIMCAVRPERISINNSSEKSIRGTVVKTAFFGSNTRYEIEVRANGESRNLAVQVPVSDTLLPVGESVSVTIESGDIRLFPVDSGSIPVVS